MWRLVKFDLSGADIRLVKPALFVKESRLSKRMEKWEFTSRSTAFTEYDQCYHLWPLTVVGHGRLVIPRSTKLSVSRQSFLIFSDITSYSYQRMYQNIAVELSCMSFIGFRRFWFKIRLLRAFKAAIEQIKCTFANWLSHVFIQPGTQRDVCFIIHICFNWRQDRF